MKSQIRVTICLLALLASVIVGSAIIRGADTVTEFRVHHPGQSILPLLIALDSKCVLDRVGGPVEYRSITVDAICAAGAGLGEHRGILGVRLVIYGLESKALPSGPPPSAYSMTPAPGERLLNDFPLPGYMAISSYTDEEGHYFQRPDRTQYFGTHEFAMGALKGLLPSKLECQSFWARPSGAKEFSLESSHCTHFGGLAGLEAFAVFELKQGATDKDLDQILNDFLSKTKIKQP